MELWGSLPSVFVVVVFFLKKLQGGGGGGGGGVILTHMSFNTYKECQLFWNENSLNENNLYWNMYVMIRTYVLVSKENATFYFHAITGNRIQ